MAAVKLAPLVIMRTQTSDQQELKYLLFMAQPPLADLVRVLGHLGIVSDRCSRDSGQGHR